MDHGRISDIGGTAGWGSPSTRPRRRSAVPRTGFARAARRVLEALLPETGLHQRYATQDQPVQAFGYANRNQHLAKWDARP